MIVGKLTVSLSTNPRRLSTKFDKASLQILEAIFPDGINMPKEIADRKKMLKLRIKKEGE